MPLSSPKVVFFDIDGVLADFVTSFTTIAARQGRIPEAYGGEECEQWNFDFHVKPVWDEVDASPTFWRELEPLISEEDAYWMRSLTERYHVAYLTSRRLSQETAQQTEHWIHRVGIPYSPVFYAKDKAVIMDALPNVAGLIDDNPNTLEQLAHTGLVTARDWPYNRHVNVPRVGSVADFCKGLLA